MASNCECAGDVVPRGMVPRRANCFEDWEIDINANYRRKWPSQKDLWGVQTTSVKDRIKKIKDLDAKTVQASTDNLHARNGDVKKDVPDANINIDIANPVYGKFNGTFGGRVDGRFEGSFEGVLIGTLRGTFMEGSRLEGTIVGKAGGTSALHGRVVSDVKCIVEGTFYGKVSGECIGRVNGTFEGSVFSGRPQFDFYPTSDGDRALTTAAIARYGQNSATHTDEILDNYVMVAICRSVAEKLKRITCTICESKKKDVLEKVLKIGEKIIQKNASSAEMIERERQAFEEICQDEGPDGAECELGNVSTDESEESNGRARIREDIFNVLVVIDMLEKNKMIIKLEKESVDKDTREKGIKDEDCEDKRSKDKGSNDKGSEDKSSEDKGSKDKGSKDKGSEDKGSEDKGSKDKGSEDKGGIDKDSEEKESEYQDNTEKVEDLLEVINDLKEMNVCLQEEFLKLHRSAHH